MRDRAERTVVPRASGHSGGAGPLRTSARARAVGFPAGDQLLEFNAVPVRKKKGGIHEIVI